MGGAFHTPTEAEYTKALLSRNPRTFTGFPSEVGQGAVAVLRRLQQYPFPAGAKLVGLTRDELAQTEGTDGRPVGSTAVDKVFKAFGRLPPHAF